MARHKRNGPATSAVIAAVIVVLCVSVVWAQPPVPATGGGSSSFYYTSTLRSTADCSAATVQAAINAAAAAGDNGTIIRCPPGQSATWGVNAVTIPSSVWLLLDLNGVIVTRTSTTNDQPRGY